MYARLVPGWVVAIYIVCVSKATHMHPRLAPSWVVALQFLCLTIIISCYKLRIYFLQVHLVPTV